MAGLPTGVTTGTVRLLDVAGIPVAERNVRIQLARNTAVTVLITSNCVDVECPQVGDPMALTECLGGRCVSPECIVESPDSCAEPMCSVDLECSSAVACAVGMCRDGWCFAVPGQTNAPNGTNCGDTWNELGCGPFDVDYCSGGSCVHNPGFNGSGYPSCGTISALCGFAPGECCGQGDGYFCVAEGGNPIYGSSYDCGQCCRPGRCCLAGNPAGPCL